MRRLPARRPEKPENILRRVKQVLADRISAGISCILVTHGDPANYLYHYLNKEPIISPWLDSDYIQMGEITQLKYENKTLNEIKRYRI